MIQVCSQCGTRWNVRDRQREWCPRCHGTLLAPLAETPNADPRWSAAPRTPPRLPPGYRWIADDDEPLPALPLLWLLAIQGAGEPPRELGSRREHNSRGDRRVPAWAAEILDDTSAIAEGGRNGVLFRLGTTLRKIGASETEILHELERANATRCSPARMFSARRAWCSPPNRFTSCVR